MAQLSEVDSRYWMMVHPHDTIGHVGPSDISVCCPICQEGGSWKRKFRLHLYIKDTYDDSSVACFNCDFKSNLWNYLKENHPREFELYKSEKRSHHFNELRLQVLGEPKEPKENTKTDISSINSGLDFTQTELPIIKTKKPNILEEGHEEKETSQEAIANITCGFDFDSPIKIDSSKESSGLDFGSTMAPMAPIEIIESTNTKIKPILVDAVKGFTKMPDDTIEYIKNRGIDPQKNWLYSPRNNKIKFNGAIQTLSEFIIIPLIYDNKWYGFQALAWKQKKFFVYMVTGNSGWKVWNWDNIDKEKPVYIFESIYDAMSSGLENVIAQLGANLGEDRINDLKEPIFCLDNQHVDAKSKEETQKYLEKGYKAFIWPKGADKFKDTNDLRKINVPYNKISNMVTSNITQGMVGILKAKMIRS